MDNYNQNNPDRAFGWEDEIVNDSSDFVLLPEGTYPFVVENFERARHNGSAKLPPCNKAVLQLRVCDDAGNAAVIKHNLFLHSKTEGLLSAFFVSVGMKKHGEPLRMNWPGTIGRRGVCKVGVREWTGDDGKVRQANEIKQFLDPADQPQQTMMPGANAPASRWQAGRF